MWNISNFKMFPQRHRLITCDGLIGDKVYFEAEAGQDRDPGIKFPVKVFTAGVLRRVVDYACNLECFELVEA